MEGAEVHWVEVPTGVRLRVLHWAGEARGTVLLLGGWKDFAEKYAETVAALTARGLAVWMLDWRGQGASTRPLADRLRSHVASFDDFLDDADRVLDRLVLPSLAGPLVLMGHSMGGHLAARLLARRPGLFARAVLVAPMIGILRGSTALQRATVALVRAVNRLPGGATAYAPGVPRKPLLGRPFEGNRLTGCPDRYAADEALLRAMPEMQLGGITWGWLQAALASIAVLRRPGFAERIEVPVLMLLAEDERVVENGAARAFALRLPDVAVVECAGARHELLRERDEVRLQVWAAIDRFLEGVPCRGMVG